MPLAFHWNFVIPESGPKLDSRSMPAVLYKVLDYMWYLYRQVCKLGLPEFSL